LLGPGTITAWKIKEKVGDPGGREGGGGSRERPVVANALKEEEPLEGAVR